MVLSSTLDLPARRQAHIDYAGVILLVLAIVGLNLLTSWAGVKYAWSSPVNLGLAAGTVIAMALFILSQRRALDPVIPLWLELTSVYADSMRVVFYTVVPIAVIGLVASLFLKDVKLVGRPAPTKPDESLAADSGSPARGTS
ncbi:hypothetical protein ACIGZJ_32175 [Kitasatospora sp. NPDC052868]|uniref:hypothetical protein n=1 Tax=Kitasatospora sp. NPDC052868 TaxID=3364060 RepID=UPI0037CA144B